MGPPCPSQAPVIMPDPDPRPHHHQSAADRIDSSAGLAVRTAQRIEFSVRPYHTRSRPVISQSLSQSRPRTVTSSHDQLRPVTSINAQSRWVMDSHPVTSSHAPPGHAQSRPVRRGHGRPFHRCLAKTRPSAGLLLPVLPRRRGRGCPVRRRRRRWGCGGRRRAGRRSAGALCDGRDRGPSAHGSAKETNARGEAGAWE